MLPGHASEILDCLSKYPLEVIGWSAPPVVSIVSLTALVVRSLYLKQIGDRDSEISVLRATHGLKDSASQSWKEKYEQAQTALATLQSKAEKTNSKSLVFVAVVIALFVGAGAGVFGTRLHDADNLRNAETRISQAQKDNQESAGQLSLLTSVLPEKTLARIPQHAVAFPRRLEADLPTPVVIFDGLGNAYKFAAVKGKSVHVKAEPASLAPPTVESDRSKSRSD